MRNGINNKECNCQTEGLAILPVRYTVVPNYIGRAKPNWANLPSVINVPLSSDYQYHVRSLREGFLYVYLPSEMGDNKWQIYSINNDGQLLKQFTAQAAESNTEENSNEYSCPNLTNTRPHYSFITIPNPKQQKKVYIAYSEFKWSEKTLGKYQKNPSERMQEIEVETWKDSGQSKTIANQQNIEQILDFDPNFDKSLLPYDDNHLIKGQFEKELTDNERRWQFNDVFSHSKDKDYKYDEKILKRNSTRTPWIKKTENSANYLAEAMQKYSSNIPAMLIAISDPIDITLELNGYYNETFGYILQYNKERELEFSTKQLLLQAEKMVVAKRAMQSACESPENSEHVKNIMISGGINRNIPINNISCGLESLLQDDYYGKPFSNKVINVYHENSYLYGNVMTYRELEKQGKNLHFKVESAKKASIRAYGDAISLYEEKAERYSGFLTEQIKFEWGRYKKLFDTSRFDARYTELKNEIHDLAKKRAKCLIAWIESDSFFTVLNDLDGNELATLTLENDLMIRKIIEENNKDVEELFHNKEISEAEREELKKFNINGLVYHYIIEQCVAGLELTEIGNKYLNKLHNIDNASVSKKNKDGIIWRALAHNNDNNLKEIQEILEKIKKDESKSVSEEGIDKVILNLKLDKIAVYYKKAQSFSNAVNNLYRAIDKATNKGVTLKLSVGKMSLKTLSIQNNLFLKTLDRFFDRPKIASKLDSVSRLTIKGLYFCFIGLAKKSYQGFIKAEHLLFSAYMQYPGDNVGKIVSDRDIIVSKRLAKVTIARHKKQLENSLIQLDSSFKEVNVKFDAAWNKELSKAYNPVKSPSNPSNTARNSIKDVRLALFVAAFEIYNWQAIMFSRSELKDDPFISSQVLMTNLALSAAVAEVAAMYTKVYKGSASAIFGRMKILSGTLGAFVGVMLAIEKWNMSIEERDKGHYGLKLMHNVSTFLLLTNSAISIATSLTYHVPWAKRFVIRHVLKAAAKGITKKIALEAAARVMMLRLLGLLAGFWIGIILIIIEIVIYLFTNNQLENWCELCFFGKNSDKPGAYEDIKKHQDEFDKMLEDMFNIEKENISEPKDSNYKITSDEALLIIEEDLKHRGVVYG